MTQQRRTFVPPSLNREITEEERRSSKDESDWIKVSHYFNDGFSTSQASYKTLNPELIDEAASRFLNYNDHLIEGIEKTLDIFFDSGFPSIPFLFPLAFPRVTDAEYQRVLFYVRHYIGEFEELSNAWLGLKVYFEWASACHLFSKGASVLIISTATSQMMAAQREIELRSQNREFALTNKKARAAFHASTAERDARNARAQQYAKEWRAHASKLLELIEQEAGKKLNNTDRARRILRRWHGLDGAPASPPTKKTIQNWLSKTKPSRAR